MYHGPRINPLHFGPAAPNLVSLSLTLRDVPLGLEGGLCSPSALLVFMFVCFFRKLLLDSNSDCVFSNEWTLLAPSGIGPSDGDMNETSF